MAAWQWIEQTLVAWVSMESGNVYVADSSNDQMLAFSSLKKSAM